MHLPFSSLAGRDRYKLLTAVVVPRPIAFITTRNPDGSVNAAPFSFFNVFSEDPPLVVLGLQSRRSGDGELKHTTRNIRLTRVFAINLVDEELAERMVDCAADFADGESEPEILGLRLRPGIDVPVAHLEAAPFVLECREITMMQFGPMRNLAIGEVLGLHCRNGLVDPDSLRVDPERYQPVARLYADRYARLRDRFSIAIPSRAEALARAENEGATGG